MMTLNFLKYTIFIYIFENKYLIISNIIKIILLMFFFLKLDLSDEEEEEESNDDEYEWAPTIKEVSF